MLLLNIISYVLLFSILNRMRGTKSPYHIYRILFVIGVALICAYTITHSHIAFFTTFIFVLVGVSMGWGTWDCVATNRNANKPTPYKESYYNGVQWLAEKIISSDVHWLNHCRLCLLLMGAYRAFFLIHLAYWCGWSAIYAFLFLTPMFWIASELGYYTSKLWNFKYMTGGWEHQEVIYGALVGLAFMILLQGV